MIRTCSNPSSWDWERVGEEGSDGDNQILEQTKRKDELIRNMYLIKWMKMVLGRGLRSTIPITH
jgi:hypothetical protein